MNLLMDSTDTIIPTMPRAAAPCVRQQRTDSFLDELERECISLFQDVRSADVPGQWAHSPVEERFLRLREVLLTTPGILRAFRRSFLSAGRLNFPDAPRPKEHYLAWDDRLAGQSFSGAVNLLRKGVRLFRHTRFHFADLHDSLVGEPTSFKIPVSIGAGMAAFARRFLSLRNIQRPRCWHFTEAQMRFFYYRSQITQLIGTKLPVVLEIGGGYGGLAAELLRHFPIERFYLVELPETLPIAYYYLRACFDCPVQALYRPEHRLDPKARIVLLAPWKMAALNTKLDLLVNTMSFQHMTADAIDYYFEHADRLETAFLYLVNRDFARDPSDVPISKYPIPQCYAVRYKKPQLFGSQIEMVLERQGAQVP